MIESSVTVARFEVVATSGPPPPGSLEICFCSDLQLLCDCIKGW